MKSWLDSRRLFLFFSAMIAVSDLAREALRASRQESWGVFAIVAIAYALMPILIRNLALLSRDGPGFRSWRWVPVLMAAGTIVACGLHREAERTAPLVLVWIGLTQSGMFRPKEHGSN